jgi:Type II secretion system (T2SS), protein E, N-terminal domain
LKDRRRPVFEGQWGCSAGCVETMVEAAVLRVTGGEGGAEGVGGHRHRVPLGLILLAQGWITQVQLQHALSRQRRAGSGSIGRWLMEECGLDQRYVTRGLGVQWGCPVLRAEEFDPDAMALVAPKLLVERLEMVPLRRAGERVLYLSFVDRLDPATALALERMSGLRVESGLVEETEWRVAQRRLCACEFVDSEFESVATHEDLARRVTSVVQRMQPRASRLVRVHQFYWLRMWLESGAMRTGDGGVPRTKEDVADRIYVVGGHA